MVERQNLPKNLEKIIEEKVEERTHELEKELEKVKQKEKEESDITTKDKSSSGLDRREFLKKSGLGALGLGALLSPVSALSVKDSSFDVFTGTSSSDLTNYLSVGQGGPVNIQNTSLELNNQNINGVNQLNGQDADSLASEGIPSGVITMWSGTTSDVPSGWTLCDGTDGAPDLRDRFVVGAGTQYSVGNTGGADFITLTESEMPSHSHTGDTNVNGAHNHTFQNTDFQDGGYAPGNNDPDYGYVNKQTSENGDHSHGLNISSAGGSQSHENRPPYYALALIMKV